MKRKAKAEIERLAEVAVWYKCLAATSVPKFLPLFFDEHRFLVLKGGGGSGKSVFAARKVIERCVCEPGHRFLVARKVGNTIKESCFRLILETLSEHYGGVKYSVNLTDKTITFANRSQIIFKGLDNVEKLKSIVGISSIWIEEASELAEGDFNQLNIRLRDKTPYYKQIIITFNPISSQHWLKRRFFDREGKDCRTHESTYLDNPFLPDEARAVLEDFKYTDEYYYMVYCLGQWGVLGKSVFNARSVAERLDSVRGIDVARGEFAATYLPGKLIRDFCFVRNENGIANVYKSPGKGVPYVIGVDTAGDGSDANVAQVLDNRDGSQVCVVRAASIDEDVFAHQLYCLGRWYNDALIAVECNFSTYVCRELQRLGYPNLYVRETFDDFTMKPKKAYGFITNTKTRPVIISGLIRVAREDIRLICDSATLSEMLTFVRDESFKPQAEEGAHDDCVMALAIAHFIRPHQDYVAKEDEHQKRMKWTESMLEDYENATSERERAELITMWGEPEEL